MSALRQTMTSVLGQPPPPPPINPLSLADRAVLNGSLTSANFNVLDDSTGLSASSAHSACRFDVQCHLGFDNVNAKTCLSSIIGDFSTDVLEICVSTCKTLINVMFW
jgi:hypothetical protein